MTAEITFHFDFSSTFAYIAQSKIEALAKHNQATVTWRPFLLGAAFKNQEGGAIPKPGTPRTDYMIRDAARVAEAEGLPFVLPRKFPFSSLQATRAFYWIDADDAQAAKAFAMAALRAAFGEGRDVSTAKGVLSVGSELGYADAALGAALEDDTVKDRVKQETAAALGKGVFGSPTFLVDDQIFWGQDRLPLLESYLEKRPADEQE